MSFTKERTEKIFGKEFVDTAEGFYETDFGKLFWSDLDDREKMEYFIKAARKLKYNEHAFKIDRRALELSQEEITDIANKLAEMHTEKHKKYGYKGQDCSCCIRTIVTYLLRDMPHHAIAVCWNEGDKIRCFDDIHEFLRSTLMKDTGWHEPFVLPKEDSE